MRRAALVLLVGAFAVAVQAQSPRPTDRPIWLAVTRPMFRVELQPLVEHRQREGLEAVVSTDAPERAVAACSPRPACILLVGDDEEGTANQPWQVPSPRRDLYRWTSAQRHRYAADAALGDLDNDGVPEVPVGRLPVRTVHELRLLVEKTIQYERRPLSADDLRLPVWAGSAMYGAAIDKLANRFLLASLDRKGPPWLQPWVLLGQADHPLAGVPAEQPATLLEQVRRGGLMSFLIGHGGRCNFVGLEAGPRTIDLTPEQARRALAGPPAAAPMVVLACDTGDFAGSEPCLAETLLLAPGGPAAVIAATTESHPLMNAYTGVAMLEQVSQGYRRLGSWFLAAQKQASKMRDLVLEAMLKDVEGTADGPVNVARLHRDQLMMYATLGDPALRIRLPQPLAVKAERTAGGWRWSVDDAPAGARLLAVGLRPPPSPRALLSIKASTRPASQPAEQALRDLLRTTNAAWEFQPLPLPPGQAWQGEVRQPGLLRVVAVGEQVLYAGAVRLSTEEASPAHPPKPNP